jgi:hypothetical protein
MLIGSKHFHTVVGKGVAFPLGSMINVDLSSLSFGSNRHICNQVSKVV